MLDNKQVKGLGLQFARALQVAIKTAAVFPVEHKSSERPIQQSFDFLAGVLKAAGQFTLGFIDKEVMLNKILTADPSLRPLETEFTKRGIAAITFDAGIPFASFKKLIYLFAAPPATVESVGGLLPYLTQNPINSLHIVAAKKQNKDEHGDTIIETDSESYILARQNGHFKGPTDFLDSIDALLESGCFDPATRADALANLAAGAMDGGGYGVPIDIPRLGVVKDGETGLSSGADHHGTGSGGNGSGMGNGSGSGTAPGASAFPSGTETGGMQRGHGHVAGGHPGGSGLHHSSTGVGTATAAAPALDPSFTAGSQGSRRGFANAVPDTFLQVVEQSVRRSLAQENGNPEKSLLSLARVLSNTGVDRILERFPEERREELRLLKPDQLAAEYLEDTALQLAGSKLRHREGSNQLALEEEALQVFSRTLQATQMADRLAAKLAKFIQDFAVPPHVQEKIRAELQWTSYPLNKRFARLLEIPHYSNLEFRRFMELAKDLLAQRDTERLATLVNHYFEFLDVADARIESTDLSRVPEIVQALSAACDGFAAKTTERLTLALQRKDTSDFTHFQAANGLATLGQCLLAREELHNVMTIGLALEKSYHLNRERHKKCCGPALASLIPADAVERILENHIQKRGDSAASRTTTTLLRIAAPASIESVMERLVRETDARNRLALVRLAGQLGSGSIEVAVKYLSDDRWYVVRNMSMVLAELRDPHLAEHIVPALRHSDPRVQQTALKALTKGRTEKSAEVLADSLPALSPEVLDEALDQLMYMRNPNTIGALEAFAASRNCNNVRGIKTVQALGSIPGPAALYALGRIFRTEELDPPIRRAALAAISGHTSPAAVQLLLELSSTWGPLAEEAKKELSRRLPEQSSS